MPLYEALKTEVLSTDSLQADESTIGVLGIKPGKLHTGYMWLYRDTKKRLVLFDFAMGRAAKYPIRILKDYKGFLQVDGYSAYEVAEIGGRDDIILLYCHTHTRRSFIKSLDYDSVRASHYISEIGKVYAIEDKIVELNLTGADKVAYREKYAQPILEQLKVWLEQQKKEVRYRAINMAPVPNNFQSIFEYLADKDEVSIVYIQFPQGYTGEQFKAYKERPFYPELFSELELKTLEHVAEIFQSTTTTDIIELSHMEGAWKSNEKNKNLISYNYAFDLQHI